MGDSTRTPLPRHRRHWHTIAHGLLALTCVLALVGAYSEPARGDVVCSRFASTSGSNSNPGTAAAPYRTVQYLVGRLGPGDVGCLIEGTFSENVSFSVGGQPSAPVTLTSAPGGRATIRGLLAISNSANDVVISNLVLNGRNTSATPSPQVNGDRVVFRGNEVTNEHSAICFALGGTFEQYGRAIDTVIDGNRIHDCGRLPATNHDHGIYLDGTRNARLTNNVIYDNADYGIHLYPDADGSYIAHNIVDGNGEGLIFAGEAGGGEYATDYASDGNTVEWNIFTNSTIRANVESWWGGPVGTGNVLRSNCVWNGKGGNIDSSEGGFTASANLVVNPVYVDRAAKNFALASGSPCSAMAPSAIPTTPAPDFALTATPASSLVERGGSAVYTIAVTAIDGFDGTVDLSTAGLPADASASFEPSSVPAGGSSVLTVTTAGSTPLGTHTVEVTATSGLTHSVSVLLQVVSGDFALAGSPSSQSTTRWGRARYSLTATGLSGFDGEVTLSVAGLPKGASASFDMNPLALTEAAASSLLVETGSAKAGKYKLTVTGSGGGRTHTTGVTLAVKNGGVKISTLSLGSSTPPRDRAMSNRRLNGEWLELANTGARRRVLDGATIRDSAGQVYRFRTLRLRPGDHVRVYTGFGHDTRGSRYWRRSRPVWNDRGDRATLRTRAGRLLDRCSYGKDASTVVSC